MLTTIALSCLQYKTRSHNYFVSMRKHSFTLLHLKVHNSDLQKTHLQMVIINWKVSDELKYTDNRNCTQSQVNKCFVTTAC